MEYFHQAAPSILSQCPFTLRLGTEKAIKYVRTLYISKVLVQERNRGTKRILALGPPSRSLRKILRIS